MTVEEDQDTERVNECDLRSLSLACPHAALSRRRLMNYSYPEASWWRVIHSIIEARRSDVRYAIFRWQIAGKRLPRNR